MEPSAQLSVELEIQGKKYMASGCVEQNFAQAGHSVGLVLKEFKASCADNSKVPYVVFEALKEKIISTAREKLKKEAHHPV